MIVKTVENLIESGVVEKVIVVTGHDHMEIQRAMKEAELPVDLVHNPDYGIGGMSSSIKVGVAYALRTYGEPEWMMVNPADVAWVHPGVYSLLACKLFEAKDRYKIVVAGYRGLRGHPILFSRGLLGELLSISEERRGLREVVERHRYETLVIETNYPGVILDLDTLNDITRIKSTVYK